MSGSDGGRRNTVSSSLDDENWLNPTPDEEYRMSRRRSSAM